MDEPTKPMKPLQKTLTTILWVCTVLAMVSVIGAGLWKNRDDAADDDLPVLAAAPSFELLDQDNKPFTLAALQGKPWVGAFVFTRCAGPCPMMTNKMAAMQKAISSPNVQLVTFTVDPEHDTPAVMKTYAKEHGADESRWHFLTGTRDAIFTTARGMLITAMPANDTNPIIHSEKFVLVDADGKIRKYYDSQDAQQLADLKADAQHLATENSSK